MSAPGAIPSIDAWTRARERFTEDLSPEEKELYSEATAESIFYGASAAEKTHKANSSSRKFATAKLRPLVGAIVEYGKALDVYANAYPLVLSPLWGSIRVVLHIALEFGDYFDKLVDMFTQIGSLLPQLRDYEKLFEGHARLALAITAIYVDILEFCADAKSIFRTAKRPSMINLLVFAKSSWRPFKDRFKITLDSFKEHRKQVEKEASISHMIEAKRAHELAHDARLKAEAEKKETERLKTLALLSTINYKQRQRRLHQLRHPGTCNWLLKLPEYQQWRASTSSTCLHCHGIPGSGKTILASAVVNELHLGSQSELHIVAYYYCDYADKSTLVSRNIIGSLLQQLLYNIQLSSELVEGIQNVFANDNASPTQQEFKDILTATFGRTPSSFLIIDGLDECDKETRRVVLSLINWITEQKVSVVRIYVSSQSDVLILNALATYPRISVSSEMLSGDIATYVLDVTQSLIQQRQLLLQNPDLEHEIIAELTKRAKGMFLWVIFQLQDLCEATSDYDIRRALNDLPEGLYETYDRKIAKIEAGQTSTLAARTLQWITAALRPLSLEEIQEAVAFDEDDTCWDSDKLPHPDKIIGSCQNLVILHEDGKLSFAHHTVRIFLLSRNSRTLRYALTFDLDMANIRAATVCLAYLRFADFEAQVVHRPQEVVQAPGSINSGGLFHLTQTLGISHIWFSLPYRLLGGSPRQQSTPTELKWTPPSSRSAVTPMLTEKYKLLDYAIQHWLLHAKDLWLIDLKQSFYKVGSLRRGSEDGHGTEVNGHKTFWERFRELVLERVMVFNHLSWACQSNYKDLPFDAMFRWALENAHVPLLILLEDPPRGPPLSVYLQRYSQNGHDILRTPCITGEIRVLEFLVRYCGEEKIESTKLFNEEYLSWCASLNGHTSVVKLLLKEMASVDAETERPHYVPNIVPNIDRLPSATALQLAVLNGHKEVVDVLLTKGASIEQLNHDGLHPLHYAPNAEIAELLLRKGADVNSIQYDDDRSYRRRPIHTAAADGRAAVVERLLSSGADPYVLDASGKTPLHCACSEGHIETVRVLLAHTCQKINSWDFNHMSPLARAVESGHADVATILIQAGADTTTIKDAELHNAAERGDVKMVDMLLGLGKPVDLYNHAEKTALQCAVERESVSVVQLLIERQAAVNETSLAENYTVDFNWSTPLIAASASGNMEIVKMLLNAGALCDTKDYSGRTALFLAVDSYHYDIARLLIAHNADPTAIARSGGVSSSKKSRKPRKALEVLEDRHEEPDCEMFELLKLYTKQWRPSKAGVGNVS